jgi:hypothetical protein
MAKNEQKRRIKRNLIISYTSLVIYLIGLIVGSLNILFGDGYLGILLFLVAGLSLYNGIQQKPYDKDPLGLVYGRRVQ